MRRTSFSLFLIIIGCLLSGPFLTGCGSGKEGTDPEEVNLLDLLQADGTVKRDLTIESTAKGRTMKYSVWLPPGFDAKNTYPFLYLLHGYGDDNNSWLDKGGAQKIARDYYQKNKVPFVIVMPDGLTDFYQGNWESYFQTELMPEVEKLFHCNGKRAVAGLSMGGYGTLCNVLAHPDRFVYGYAMSPATNPAFEDLMKEKDAGAFPPITMESGTQDFTVSIQSVRDFASLLDKYGIKYEFIERDGGHDWNFWPECLRKALVKIAEAFS